MPIPGMSKLPPIAVENESVLLDARGSPSLKLWIVVPSPVDVTKGFDRGLQADETEKRMKPLIPGFIPLLHAADPARRAFPDH